MPKIYDNILELVGNTPIVRADRFAAEASVRGELLVKVESFNPNGSVKDRVGVAMLESAEREGVLKKGGTVIEPTSGNTGIGLAMACAVKGYRLILTMPESMSIERRRILSGLNAEVVLTPAGEGMLGAIKKAEELNAEIGGSIIASQFTNPANPRAHRDTTAKEIIRDLDRLDYFVAGVGTGGTLSGTAEGLKAHFSDVKAVAVEPADSPLLSGGAAAPHKLQGIGANFIPQTLNVDMVDMVKTVTADEAYAAARAFSKVEGYGVGISAGAALSAAVKVLQADPGKRVLVILPDAADRYLSTDLFE